MTPPHFNQWAPDAIFWWNVPQSVCYLQIYSYQFCNLYIQRQDCYLNNFMLDVMRLHLHLERENEVWGAGRVGRGEETVCSSRHTSWGVVKETKRPTGGSVSPFAQRSLPAQAWKWEICRFWPRRGPGMATVRRSQLGDLGPEVHFHRWGPGHPKKGLPHPPSGQDWPGGGYLAWASSGSGRGHPTLPVHCPLRWRELSLLWDLRLQEISVCSPSLILYFQRRKTLVGKQACGDCPP